MTASTLTLAGFLLARIAEDEAAAKEAEEGGEDSGSWWSTGQDRKVWGSPSARTPMAEAHSWRAAPHIARHDPARVLAECEAKRRIVELHGHRTQWVEDDQDALVCRECGEAGGNWPVLWPCPTLRLLALPYADHPDYDERWRP